MSIPDSLQQAIDNDRLAHAYLFYGRRPAESNDVILPFFKQLACLKQKSGYCDSCRDCLQIDQLHHPDFTAINPPADCRPDEAAVPSGRIGVDRVREEIITPSSLTSTRAPYTLFWLNDMSQFTKQATNALLKVLEEPPGDTVFALTARSLGDCLPTIRSRCQWVRFAPEQIEWETELDACNALWPDESWSEDEQKQWRDLLEGTIPSRSINWTRSGARGFLTWILMRIHGRYTNKNKSVNSEQNMDIGYRLIPEILDRLWELEHGGSPIFVVNSLLEEIHYPEASSPCQAVI